jgi:NADH:ubiquinone oxidoreductase subunit E
MQEADQPVKLHVDGVEVTAEAGETLLQLATRNGIDIPTLCHSEWIPPQTSCFLCVVEIEGQGDLAPSCGTLAVEGMVVSTGSERVRASRRTCLELLFSDHAGTCVGKCTLGCPAKLDVSAFLDAVAVQDSTRALQIARDGLALPAVLGRLCAGHCESACLRGDLDASVSVRQSHGALAEADLATESPTLPDLAPPSGKVVAIVGAGAAGLSAAFHLLKAGHRCVIHDRQPRPGGLLRESLASHEGGEAALDLEIGSIARMGAEIRCGWTLGTDGDLDSLRQTYDAVVLALGASRGWPGPKRQAPLGFLEEQSIEVTRKGVRIMGGQARTSLDGVFAAGEVVTGPATAIRNVAAGRSAGEAIDLWLEAPDAGSPPLPYYFRSRMTEEELETMLSAEPGPRVEDAPPGSTAAAQEASRCLDCTCAAADDCDLRALGAEYGAVSNRYRGQRRLMEIDDSHALVRFEPGKCIVCGLCLEVGDTGADMLGLAMTGRGFSATVSAPFGEPFAAAMEGRLALAAADICPAGAITRKPGQLARKPQDLPPPQPPPPIALEGDLTGDLHDVQDEHGWLPREELEAIARKHGVSPAHVYGVASFYERFHLEPRGETIVRVCHGTACHVVGAERITESIGEKLNIEDGGTTDDRKFTLETVACLGCCSLAPVATVGERTHGRLDTTKARELIQTAIEATAEPSSEEAST